MAGLPGIVVKITADVQDAINGINRVERAVDAPTSAFDRFGKVAVAAGGAIAAAFTLDRVVAFLQDSMQAAMEDEKSMVALAKAMENVGVASQNASVEAFVKSLSMGVGVADDQLRPALQRIITVTGDVAKSQEALKLALDISAGSGKDLESVSTALAKAYGGQTTALGRLGVGLDAALLKSKDMDAITGALSDKFQGQAAAAAETYQGKLNRVTVAANEAKETIGYALLNAIDNMSRAVGGTGGATTVISKFGDAIADLISTGTRATSIIGRLGDAMMGSGAGSRLMTSALDGMIEATKQVVGGPVYMAVKVFDSLTSTEEANARAVGALSARYAGLAVSIDAANRTAADRAGISMSNVVDGRDWGAFYQGNQTAQKMMSQSRADIDNILAKARDAAAAARRAAGGGGGSSQSSAEKNAQDAAKKAADAMQQRLEQLKSYAEQAGKSITGFLSIDAAFTAFSDRQKAASDAYAALIEAQKKLGEDATQAEKDRVAELQTVYDNAKAAASKGAQDIVGEFVARAEKAREFGEKLKILLANNLNKQTFDEIAGMSAERGVEVANAFINGNISQNIARVNSAVASAKTVADQVGVQAASTFKDVGEGLAQGMMAALAAVIRPGSKQSKAIQSMMDTFAASLNRVSTVDVITRRYELGQPPPSVPSSGIDWAGQVAAVSGVTNDAISDADFNQAFDRLNAWAAGTWTPMATGGIVTGPTPAIVGEAGPEAIIPLSRVPQMMNGGNSYQITVQAGVGDPRAIGQQVVEYITRWENANGQRYARV